MQIETEYQKRLAFHSILAGIMQTIGKWQWDPFDFEEGDVYESTIEEGDERVYFQPPSTVRMYYPCIVYSKDSENVRHANNKRYNAKTRYDVTVIDLDPDSEICEMVKEIPYSHFDRSYTADNLNHYAFTIYY